MRLSHSNGVLFRASERLVAYKRKDAFYKKAKAAGYRSRAAYKLLELNRAWRFLRSGGRVIDLGAWPGGWLQVAAAAVGPTGRVIGIDLVKLEPLPTAHVRVLQGDVHDPAQQQALLAGLGRRADVVLSDMAPKLSGMRETDAARASTLSRLAVRTCRRLLRPGGALFLKTFMNAEQCSFLEELQKVFTTLRKSRPEATRKGSTELYILATGHTGEPTAPSDDAAVLSRSQQRYSYGAHPELTKHNHPSYNSDQRAPRPGGPHLRQSRA